MIRISTLLILGICAFWPWLLNAQDAASPKPTSESNADDAASPVAITVAPGGMPRYVPGTWGTVSVNATNSSDIDSEALAMVTIGDEKELQFARRLWVPANSQRQSWLPVLIPGDIPRTQLQAEMTSIHVVESEDGTEDYQMDFIGQPTQKRSLLLSRETSRTMVIIQKDGDEYDSTRLEDIIETVYLGRDVALSDETQDLGLIQFTSGFLPPSPKSLDVVDQIVVGNQSILDDSGAVSQLRSWLRSGGRMWVLLDQMEEQTVRRLLGDACCYSEVDRVELNEFEMKMVEATAGGANAKDEWSSEESVEFVRVLANPDGVYCSINGWPAAFWKQVGSGQVIFTTLGARGWHQSGDSTTAYHIMANEIFSPRNEPPRYREEMIAFLQDDIGYQIPSRRTIGLILTTQLLVTLIVGIGLAMRRQLQHLAILVPVVAMSATVVLLALGKKRTAAVPSTIATGQIAQVSDETSDVHVNSIAAVYSQRGRTLGIESTSVATTWADPNESRGEVKRLEFRDNGHSVWENVSQPPGVVRHIESEATLPLKKPWAFQGRFTSLGLMGRVVGLNQSKCRDAVVVSPAAPPLAVEFEADTATFVGGEAEVMMRGQYANSRFLSDVQRGRQELLRELLKVDPVQITKQLSPFGNEPTMLVWTDPIETGVAFSSGYYQRGSALIALPIQLQRTGKDSTFVVPASMVELRAFAGENGVSTVYNDRTGLWLSEINRPYDAQLHCVLPDVVVPCDVTRANITLKILAPSRTLRIQGFVDGELTTFQEVESPTGKIEFAIDNAAALKLDDEGGFRLVVSVSESASEITRREEAATAAPSPPQTRRDTDAASRETWQIEYFHVSVTGVSQG